MKPTEKKEKFLQLRAEGYSFQAISDQLEVSKQTLINWSKDIHVQAELQNIKTVRMESLYEQFALSKEGRVKLLGELINRIKEEISTRDFTKVSTDKLFDILLKLTEAQNKERESLTFIKPNPCQEYRDEWAV